MKQDQLGPSILDGQRKLFDWWLATAYRGAPSPAAVVGAVEFSRMVKRCECGDWHLEFEAKCSKCSKPNQKGKTK